MANEKKSSSSGVGLGIDFSLNPCAALMLLYLIPPAVLFWLTFK